MIVCHVRRAYLYAQINRDVFIELPEEDLHQGENLVGKLRLCLYGTRTPSLHLESVGFTRGRGHPRVSFKEKKGIKALVHRDDCVASGSASSLEGFKKEMEKAYEIQTQRIGGEEGRPRKEQVLDGIIRCTDHGFEKEADPRHAELVMEQKQVEGEKCINIP